jgi:hypothetical protein
MIMNQQTIKRAVVIAIAGAVALGAVSTVSAAPVLSSTAALNNAAPSSVIDVRYYRHGNYRNYCGPGVAFGALGAAAAIAGAATYGNGYYGNRYYGNRYYGNRGYYGRDYYGSGPSFGY